MSFYHQFLYSLRLLTRNQMRRTRSKKHWKNLNALNEFLFDLSTK